MKGRYESHSVPADDRRQRALSGELNGYYDEVIAAVSGLANVFLLGPGEAKEELHRRLGKMRVAEGVVTTAVADKMSDREIIAKVREHFGRGAARR